MRPWFKVSSERLEKLGTEVYKASSLTTAPWRLHCFCWWSIFRLNVYALHNVAICDLVQDVLTIHDLC